MTYKEWISEENLLKLEAWARDGLTEADIAHNIGISTQSLWDWKNKHLDVLAALKKGKEVADIRVENALYKRAIGYDAIEEKTIIGADGDVSQTIKQVKHIAPDTTAQIFWLKNRRPELWRDKVVVDANMNSGEKLKDMQDFLKVVKGENNEK